MNRKAVISVKFLFLVILLIGYNDCIVSDDLGGSLGRSRYTEVGNPFSPSMKILTATCEVLLKAHPGLTAAQCQEGILSTSFSNALGVPPQTLNPFWNLSNAEQAGAVIADSVSLQNCLADISALNPGSSQVAGAYYPAGFDPFKGVAAMIPTNPASCPRVYSNNAFSNPRPTPTPPPGVTVVDFDNPLPPQDLVGIYQGIDFTNGGLSWNPAFDADTTDFAYNGMSQPGDLYFSFSGGPKLLLSIDAFMSTSGGTITIYDDQGQSFSQYIPSDHVLHSISTGFTKVSNKVYINGPTIHNLGIDNITYKQPDVPPAIVQIQSLPYLGQVGLSHTQSFSSGNSAGDLIVVLINWDQGATIQSLQDSLGNVYIPASAVGTGNYGNMQQIWYAKNILGGSDTVTVTLTQAVNCSFSINEYAGVDKTAPLDVTTTASGYGMTPDSGYVTTHFPSELIFGGVYGDSHQVVSLGAEFVLRATTLETDIAFDRVVTGTGTYNASATYSWDLHWIAQIVTFKAGP